MNINVINELKRWVEGPVFWHDGTQLEGPLKLVAFCDELGFKTKIYSSDGEQGYIEDLTLLKPDRLGEKE